MLGTRIIMLSMSCFPGDEGQQPEAEVICAANHEIPLFWLIPFSRDDMQYFEVATGQDGILSHSGSTKYPVLLAERSKLLARLEQRFMLLKDFIAESDAVLLQRWIQFLRKQSSPVLAMDTYELWCNSNQPDQLAEEIQDKLVLFEGLSSDSAENTLEQLKQLGLWQEGNQISLAGFGW